MSDDSAFNAFFGAGSERASGTTWAPHPYQRRLARNPWPETLIIPTGFGKTAAVLAAWLWKRRHDRDHAPTRLIYCLPMRTLVEQTATVAEAWCEAAADHFKLEKTDKAKVHVLMGGAEETPRRGVPEWIMEVDRPRVLIGTQDMLVSAALMRGYGTSRYRWPVDFALLHTDALWVLDEVQLAGAALPTSAQLEGWRRKWGAPKRTMWMSATLDPAWLKTPDFKPGDEPSRTLAPKDLESEHAAKLWGAVKRLSRATDAQSAWKSSDEKAHGEATAALAASKAQDGKTVLVFLNTVGRAQKVFDLLTKAGEPGVVLLHSRFRPPERKEAMARIKPGKGEAAPRIIVATQALEAGVDLTSAVLITELAPWSSLVQRIGRCNRYGECEGGAEVLWLDLPDGAAAPYAESELAEARGKLAGLPETDGTTDCGPEALSAIPPSPPPVSQVIRRRDFLDFFDTEADLSGFDVDVSMYVRDTDDTDVRLFWRELDPKGRPLDLSEARRAELCPAPIGRVRPWLKGKTVWTWSPLDKEWLPLRPADLRPGLNLMIAAPDGGYDLRRGFDPNAKGRVPVVPLETDAPDDPPPGNDDDEDSYIGRAVSLADHSRHVHDAAKALCDSLEVDEALKPIIVEAALWHDRGKAHPVFQALLDPLRKESEVLAKSADSEMHDMAAKAERRAARKALSDELRRKGFRHELASALAYLEQKGWAPSADLPAYLIAAHHGKVRMGIRALPTEDSPEDDRLFARGVWQGDRLPESALGEETAPAVSLDLDIMQLGEGPHGPSWSARTQALLREHGPFKLAWLEALVRIADWRASDAERHDKAVDSTGGDADA